MANLQKKYIIIIIIINIIFVQGCSQVIRTEMTKGNLLNEIPTGNKSEFSRTPVIELLSATEVKLIDKVTYKEEFEQYYEKNMVDTIADKNFSCVIKNELYRPLFTITVFMIFMPDYWTSGFVDCKNSADLKECCTIRSDHSIETIAGERIIDKTYKNDILKNELIKSGDVAVKINDIKIADIPINSDGIAKLRLEKYYDTLAKNNEVKIEYKFKSATITTSISYTDVDKVARDLVPIYRENGINNKSASDLIIAYKISKDLSDLQEAIKYASTEADKNEVNRLKTEYDDALDNSRYELAISSGKLRKFITEYPESKHIQNARNIIDKELFDEATSKNKLREFIKQNPDNKYISDAKQIVKREDYQKLIANSCKGDVMDMLSFLRDSNMFADKGKCVSIVAGKMQITSSNSGLFKIMGDKLVYIEFPTEFRGFMTQGLARIRGEYNYVTQLGSYNSVPHLQMLVEVQ